MPSTVYPPLIQSAYVISSNDKTAFSILRIFAAFSVIVVHVADPSLDEFNNSGNFDWWVGHTYQSVFRSGIPLFLMLTGALVLPKAEGISFIKNRLLRVSIPLAIWTLIFLIAKHKIADLTISHYFYDLIFGNNYTYHFWYVYFMMQVYILMPLLKYIINRVQPTVSLIFVMIVVLSTTTYFIPEENELLLSLHKKIVYIGYIIVGYCFVYTKNEKWMSDSLLATSFIVIGFLITIIGTYLDENKLIMDLGTLYDSAKLHLFFKAIGVWILVRKYANIVCEKKADYLRYLSNLCFGIYLIHPLVLEHIVIVRLGISINTFGTVVGTGLTSVLCLIIGATIIFLFSKLPFGKYTF